MLAVRWFSVSNSLKILGLKNDATEEAIRKAYQQQARKFHPDST
jgi:curved DNA-binding protein CbpA